jgi:putative FmdB family regulatory protein
MAVYLYKCLDCHEEFGIMLNISERYNKETEIICPECGSLDNKNLVARTSFTLKGDRWYKDNYGK